MKNNKKITEQKYNSLSLEEKRYFEKVPFRFGGGYIEIKERKLFYGELKITLDNNQITF